MTSIDFANAKITKYAWDEKKCELKDSSKDFRFRKIPGIYEFLIVYDDDEGKRSKEMAATLASEGKFKKDNILVLQGHPFFHCLLILVQEDFLHLKENILFFALHLTAPQGP